MAFDKSNIFGQIKSNLKLILIGIAVIAFLSFSFIVAIGLIVALIIAVPILRFWRSYQLNKKAGKSNKNRDIGDFIDADYGIIESKNREK